MPNHRHQSPLVQVVGPSDGWILDQLSSRLASKLPYACRVADQPDTIPGTQLVYYINYALYKGPSGLVDVAFFTHEDESQQFFERARQVDHCICMSKHYADRLREYGIEHVTHIPMGFDAYQYRPKLVLGIVSRLDHPRKGKHLIEQLQPLPFIELVITDGRVSREQVREVYQHVDYVLIPALVEGGPLSLLEGLAMGKRVIAPENVGMVPEFPETESIRRYPAGDIEALVKLVSACYEKKLQQAQLVQGRTWDHWAEAHHRLFLDLLQKRGIRLPAPAPAFRFGMLQEVEVPLGIDTEPLENLVDRVAAHVYYGRYDVARSLLEESVSTYPFLRSLLATIPRTRDTPELLSSKTAHAQALR